MPAGPKCSLPPDNLQNNPSCKTSFHCLMFPELSRLSKPYTGVESSACTAPSTLQPLWFLLFRRGGNAPQQLFIAHRKHLLDHIWANLDVRAVTVYHVMCGIINALVVPQTGVPHIIIPLMECWAWI